MKSFYSATEIAGLPGMPGSKRGVQKRARREKWRSRPRKKVGGGREYHIDSFPEESREFLYQQNVESLPTPRADLSLAVRDKEPTQRLESLQQWQRDIFDARLAIYREFERLKEIHGTKKAIDELLFQIEEESLPAYLIDAASRANAKGRTISRSMILTFQRLVRKGGIAALAPLPKKQETKIPEWAPYFIKAYNIPSKPSIRDAMFTMANIMPEGMGMPSYDQVKRFNSKRSTVDRETGRNTGTALRKYKGYIQRDTSDLEPLEVCMCDGHSFKGKVAHFHHGRPFSPELCAVIDCKTRVVIGWSAGVAESGQTVADALRHAITVNEQKRFGGTPAIFYTDGGSGNKSKLNSARVTGFYDRLGIDHRDGIPGNAMGRGMIERLNKSLWIRAAKRLPTFTGKEMDALVQRNVYLILNKEVRQGVKTSSVLPTWQQFIALCDEQVDIYNRTPHSSLPKWNDPETGKRRHMAPLEYLALHLFEGWKPEPLPQEIVNDMFYPQIIRTCMRGAVSFMKNRYSNRSVLEAYHGQKVVVEYDIHNAETVRIRDVEQRLLCTASFSSSRQRMFPKEVSQMAIEKRVAAQEKLIDQKREDVLAQLGTVVDLNADTDSIPLSAEEESKVAELMEQSEPLLLDEPEFDEAMLLSDRGPALGDAFAEQDDIDTQELEEDEQGGSVIDARENFSQKQESDDENWENFDGFERYEYLERLEQKQRLNKSQIAWMRYYETTDEYKVLQQIYKYQEEQK